MILLHGDIWSGNKVFIAADKRNEIVTEDYGVIEAKINQWRQTIFP